MPATGSARSIQARKAAAVRWGHTDVEVLTRDLKAARLEDYIQRVVAEAPPLTAAQRDRLTRLLAGGGSV